MSTAEPPEVTRAAEPGERLRRRSGAHAADLRGTSPTRSILLACDGGARGNPGPAAIGAVVYDTSREPPDLVASVSERIGIATNNVAEYRALVRGLELAAGMEAHRIHVRADSQLLIRQLEGRYRVKNAGLKPWFERAEELLARYDTVVLEHVPREQNVEADTLVNAALDAPG